MLHDPRLHKLADVLVNYSTKVKKGDLVAVIGDPAGMPLALAISEAVIKAGGNPFLWPRSEAMQELLVAHATPEQIAFSNPVMLSMIEQVDVTISYWAEQNTKFLSRYDAGKAALLQQARKPFLKRMMQREAEGTIRWCGTQYPTQASAQDAEMSLTQYADFVFKAGLLHLENPAAAWQQIHLRQERLREYLQTKKTLRFIVPPHTSGGKAHDGTDLTVDVSKGIWCNCSGHSNFPDGEVYCGPTLPPHGFGVDGHVNYTFPAVYQGHEVHNVRLQFKAGRVVDASASKGEDFLFKMLDQDAGARNLGEIAIGTNYEITGFSKNTLFDEKIGGTFHAAVGAGYPKSGNDNESGLHWDMVCDLRTRETGAAEDLPGGTITADGEIFHHHGRLTKSWN